MSPGSAQSAPCSAVARTLGWLTSVATMVVLGFIANRWPDKIGSVAGGMVGVAVALLNDSWQIMSIANSNMGFEVMPPPRVMLHDMVSMAISLGGLVLVVFTGTSAAGAPDDYDLQSSLDSTKFGEAFTLRRLMMAAQWFMVAVVIWRLIFAIWGCYECVKQAQPQIERDRFRREMEEAQTFDA